MSSVLLLLLDTCKFEQILDTLESYIASNISSVYCSGDVGSDCQSHARGEQGDRNQEVLGQGGE